MKSVLTIDDISLEIASGIACALSQVVSDGVLHLRPFSVTEDGQLSIFDAPRIPQSAVPTNKMRFEVGDILFNNTNSVELVGKSAVFSSVLDASFSNHMTRIRLDRRHAEPGYVHAFLQHLYGRRFFQDRATRWVSQAAFGAAQLKALAIPLPQLNEQRRIVNVLDRATEIRRRANAARAKARAIIPALFLDTFGDSPTKPREWPYEELSNVADIGSGLTKGRRLNGQRTVLSPYLRVANVQDGYLDLSEVKVIDATPADLEKCVLRSGDLLMTEGGDADKLGRCAIWREEVAGCLHQNHIFRVRVGQRLLPEYTAAFIQSGAGKSYFLRVAKRTTGIASVNKTQLGALPVLVPPMALQAAFAEQAQRLEALARHLDAASAKAEAMAAALSAEVFRSSQPEHAA